MEEVALANVMAGSLMADLLLDFENVLCCKKTCQVQLVPPDLSQKWVGKKRFSQGFIWHPLFLMICYCEGFTLLPVGLCHHVPMNVLILGPRFAALGPDNSDAKVPFNSPDSIHTAERIARLKTDLKNAVIQGDIAGVREVLDSIGENPQLMASVLAASDESDRNALRWAVLYAYSSGQDTMFKSLWASREQFMEIASLLIEATIATGKALGSHQTLGEADLLWMAEKNFDQSGLQLARVMSRMGGSLEVRDYMYRTPLMLVAKHGNYHFTAGLIKAGARLDAEDEQHRNALFFTILGGHYPVARLLLGHGARLDLNIQKHRELLELIQDNSERYDAYRSALGGNLAGFDTQRKQDSLQNEIDRLAPYKKIATLLNISQYFPMRLLYRLMGALDVA
jgi:hypothetical protein